MRLTLPWPPSINHYYRMASNGIHISRQGREYRATVCGIVRPKTPLCGRLRVEIACHQPDRRTRDIDNVCKATLDSLQHAEVYDNDGQIDQLSVVRVGVDRDNPRVEVEIVEL